MDPLTRASYRSLLSHTRATKAGECVCVSHGRASARRRLAVLSFSPCPPATAPTVDTQPVPYQLHAYEFGDDYRFHSSGGRRKSFVVTDLAPLEAELPEAVTMVRVSIPAAHPVTRSIKFTRKVSYCVDLCVIGGFVFVVTFMHIGRDSVCRQRLSVCEREYECVCLASAGLQRRHGYGQCVLVCAPLCRQTQTGRVDAGM